MESVNTFNKSLITKNLRLHKKGRFIICVIHLPVKIVSINFN